jgi:aspartate racemase
MKTAGLIGGISWVSTMEYYRLLNETIAQQFGGNVSAPLLIYSFNYSRVLEHTFKEDWDGVTVLFTEAAQKLQQSGADCLVLCANTAHLVAPHVQQAVSIPIISIVDATTAEVINKGLKKVLLLGTRFTMTKAFYKEKLEAAGVEVMIPDAEDMNFIHRTIFDELGKGIYTEPTKAKYISIINKLAAQGAEGVLFACTEIPLIIKPEEVSIPSFDTTAIHVKEIAEFMTS